MKTLKMRFSLILSLLLVLSCNTTSQSPTPTVSTSPPPVTSVTASPTTQPLAFKGFELYSWKSSDGKLYFSLLLGTNRNKVAEDLTSNKIESLTELKNKLSTLAKGEIIFWNFMHIEGITFESPDKNTIDEILNLAKEKGLEIQGLNTATK